MGFDSVNGLSAVRDNHDSPEPVTRDILFEVELAEPVSMRRIQARRITMLPNHPAGIHIHNGPVVGVILDGSAIFEVDGQPAESLGPADVFYEPEGVRIARFDAGPDGVTFLAFFPLRAGQTPGLELSDE